jgi:hypothetical protein
MKSPDRFWTETTEQMYYRHAVRVLMDRLGKSWNLHFGDPDRAASALLTLHVQTPDGCETALEFHSAQSLHEQLQRLEWDWLWSAKDRENVRRETSIKKMARLAAEAKRTSRAAREVTFRLPEHDWQECLVDD